MSLTVTQWARIAAAASGGVTVRYVNTNSTAGGTGLTNATSGADRAYATLSEAVAALPSSIVATAGPWRIICSGSVVDGGVTIPASCVTSSTRYIEIAAATSDRTQGYWDTTKYRIETTNVDGIRVLAGHVRVVGLQMKLTYTTSGSLACVRGGDSLSASDYLEVDDCLFLGAMSGGFEGGHGVYVQDTYAARSLRVRNSVASGFYMSSLPAQAGGYGFRSDYVTGSSSYFYNCTAHQCGVGFSSRTETAYNSTAINCLSACDVFNSGRVDFSSTWRAGSSNNLSTDTTAPGTSSLTGQTLGQINFVSTTTTDTGFLDLNTGSTALDAGATIIGFSSDIRLRTRTEPWSIGANEPNIFAIPIVPTPRVIFFM